VKAQLKAAAFLETFIKYPPSQRGASFNLEGVRAQIDKAIDQSFKDRGIEK
jgi:arylsulfatase